MTGFLTSRAFMDSYGEEARRIAGEAGLTLEPVYLPSDESSRLVPEDVENVEIAYFSGDIIESNTGRAFFAAAQGAPRLQWMHCFNAGVDNPVFTRIMQKGVRLTTSSGSTAMPIANSVMTGLLLLSRGFLGYAEAQKRHEWGRIPVSQIPVDLSRQTLTVFGMGAIGTEIARLGKAFGLNVIGVRRSPHKDGDPVDELVPPSQLATILPRTDWLALACPLTDETRRVIDATALASLPRGARILNIARGEVIDEQAMVESLRSGHLGGAYLDVFEVEPLQTESPLWDMPNVIISPHNSAASTGNHDRAAGYFYRNLERWARGSALINEARLTKE